MNTTTREVLDLLFEFILSMVIIIGAGFLIYKAIAPEFCTGLITLVVGYWFTNRSNTTAVKNLLTQPPAVKLPESTDTTQTQTEQTKTGQNI
jgi:hypothetical protein